MGCIANIFLCDVASLRREVQAKSTGKNAIYIRVNIDNRNFLRHLVEKSLRKERSHMKVACIIYFFLKLNLNL